MTGHFIYHNLWPRRHGNWSCRCFSVAFYSLAKLATIDNSGRTWTWPWTLHTLSAAPWAEGQAIDLMRCQRLSNSVSNGVVSQLAGPGANTKRERKRERKGEGCEVAAKVRLQSTKLADASVVWHLLWTNLHPCIFVIMSCPCCGLLVASFCAALLE